MFVCMGRPDPADGDAIFLLLEHVCILILKRAYVEFKLCRKMLELCAAPQRLSYELMVPKVTQVINSFCSRAAPTLPCLMSAYGFFFLLR